MNWPFRYTGAHGKSGRTVLELRKQRLYEKTSTIGLEYDIVRSNPRS